SPTSEVTHGAVSPTLSRHGCPQGVDRGRFCRSRSRRRRHLPRHHRHPPVCERFPPPQDAIQGPTSHLRLPSRPLRPLALPLANETRRRLRGVVAPALLPQKPGDRGKTDRTDAMQWARLARSGALPVVDVPQVDEEALRALARARADTLRALQAATCRLQ